MKAAHWGVVALGSIAGVAMMAMPAAADGDGGPPPPYERGYYPSIWQGLYAGVNAGVGWAGAASGAVGGGQVGYNWRSQQFVYGVEGDIQASDIGVDARISVCGSMLCCSRIDAGASIDWFSTIRGRAGILVQPNLLVYATAGVAIVHTEAHVRSSFGSVSISETDSGFVGGVGVEGKINETMSWRVEYLYFGHPADCVIEY